MLAIQFSSAGHPGILQLKECPNPEIRWDEVLIQVEAAGVSRADVFQRQGKYPPPPGASPILGLDVAGVIVEVGTEAAPWKVGDRVCALVSGGGYAELCAAPAVQVLPIPEGWCSAEAVTLPENLFTVYDNMVTRARLKAGDLVLVHGGTSGIGSMAIMLARAAEATVFATAGSDEKCRASQQFGAEVAINYRKQDFVAAVLATAKQGVDVVVDIIGGAYLEKNIDVLAVEGRLAIIATLGGGQGNLPISKLMHKRGTITASTLRARTPSEKGAIASQLLRNIWPLLPARQFIRPLIDSTFPLANASKAHERMEAGDHIGKIVLTTSAGQ